MSLTPNLGKVDETRGAGGRGVEMWISSLREAVSEKGRFLHGVAPLPSGILTSLTQISPYAH